MECSIAPRILILIFGRHILIWGGPNACKCGSVVARRAFWSPGPHEYCDAHNLRIADGHLHVRESGREGGGDYRVGEDLERKRGLQRTYHLPNGIGERHRRLPSGCCAYWTPRARSQVAWSGPTAGPSVVVVAVAVVFVWFNEMTSTLRGNDRGQQAIHQGSRQAVRHGMNGSTAHERGPPCGVVVCVCGGGGGSWVAVAFAVGFAVAFAVGFAVDAVGLGVPPQLSIGQVEDPGSGDVARDGWGGPSDTFDHG